MHINITGYTYVYILSFLFENESVSKNSTLKSQVLTHLNRNDLLSSNYSPCKYKKINKKKETSKKHLHLFYFSLANKLGSWRKRSRYNKATLPMLVIWDKTFWFFFILKENWKYCFNYPLHRFYYEMMTYFPEYVFEELQLRRSRCLWIASV